MSFFLRLFSPLIAVLEPWGRGVQHCIVFLYWRTSSWSVDDHAKKYLFMHAPRNAGDWYLAGECARMSKELQARDVKVVAGPLVRADHRPHPHLLEPHDEDTFVEAVREVG